MEHRDAEMSEVIIILRAECDGKTPAAVDDLKAAGLQVSNVDADNGVVEGDVETAKLSALRKLSCVETARVTFTWVADYPTGDSRDGDGKEGPDDSDE